MSRKSFFRCFLVLTMICALFLTSCGAEEIKVDGKTGDEVYNTYECDARVLSTSTKISVTKDSEDFCLIKGNFFKPVTDPLTMYDNNDNKIGYAGDDYHVVSQDSHSIVVDGKFTAELEGNFDMFGESYKVYNPDGNLIANVSFGMSDTSGEMYDTNDNLIATYSSNYFGKDYTVKVSKICPIDDKTVLLIMASYYSDKEADKKSKKKNR